MPTPEPAATATPKSAATDYMVLAERNNGERPTSGSSASTLVYGKIWQPLKTVKARSATEAVKLAAGETAGTYMAVPARSWKPVTVTVEQTTRIRLT